MHSRVGAGEQSASANRSASITAEGISSNPAAVDIRTGTGELAETMEKLAGLPQDSGVFLGGVWVGNANGLFSAGAQPGKWSFNSLLNIGATLDANKLVGCRVEHLGSRLCNSTANPPMSRRAVCKVIFLGRTGAARPLRI